MSEQVASNSAGRVRAHRQRKRDQGLIQVPVWVHPTRKDQLKKLERETLWRAKGE